MSINKIRIKKNKNFIKKHSKQKRVTSVKLLTIRTGSIPSKDVETETRIPQKFNVNFNEYRKTLKLESEEEEKK